MSGRWRPAGRYRDQSQLGPSCLKLRKLICSPSALVEPEERLSVSAWVHDGLSITSQSGFAMCICVQTIVPGPIAYLGKDGIDLLARLVDLLTRSRVHVDFNPSRFREQNHQAQGSSRTPLANS